MDCLTYLAQPDLDLRLTTTNPWTAIYVAQPDLEDEKLVLKLTLH